MENSNTLWLEAPFHRLLLILHTSDHYTKTGTKILVPERSYRIPMLVPPN